MALLSAIVGIINFAYIKMDVRDKDETGKFTSMPEHIQICNFGSSHGLYSFNYNEYNDKFETFNFGLLSQTLSYDELLMTYYQEHIGKGTIVFLPVSYFSFFGKREIDLSTFKTRNNRYYAILPKEFIKEYDYVTDILIRYLPSLAEKPKEVAKVLMGKSSNRLETIWKKTALDQALLQQDGELSS